MTTAQAIADRVKGAAAWNFTTGEKDAMASLYANQYGKFYVFKDGSRLQCWKGSATPTAN